MMKEITVWECEYCKKLFKTPDKHKCKFNPELKNCFTCKHFIVWEDNFDGYISTTPHPECDIEASEGWDIETLQGTIGVIPYETMEREALKRAIKALEKQVPMKTRITGMKFKALDVETKEVVMYECSPCPSCEKWLSKIYKYCPHCGQRIEES